MGENLGLIAVLVRGAPPPDEAGGFLIYPGPPFFTPFSSGSKGPPHKYPCRLHRRLSSGSKGPPHKYPCRLHRRRLTHAEGAGGIKSRSGVKTRQRGLIARHRAFCFLRLSPPAPKAPRINTPVGFTDAV